MDEYTFQPAELHLKKSAPMIRKRNLSYQWQQQHTDFTILRDGEKAVSGPFLTFQNREKPAQISTVRIHKIDAYKHIFDRLQHFLEIYAAIFDLELILTCLVSCHLIKKTR